MNTDCIKNSEPLFRVLNKMNGESVISDEKYAAFFREGSAEKGVKAILSAGKFFVNGFPVPAEAAEFGVNSEMWLTREGEGWHVDRKVFDSYADAAFAIVDRLPAGIDVNAYDTDGDGFADLIDTWCPDAMIAAALTRGEDGTVVLDRGSLDAAVKYSDKDGIAYFGPKPEIRIKPENLAADVREGDMVLVSRHPDGWHAERALEVRGFFMGGVDHENYIVSGEFYPDAMRFSRGNIIVSNRNGEFSNAQKYFGLNEEEKRRELSFWLMKCEDFPARKAAPIGFTCGENAKYFLQSAVDTAKAKLEQGRKNAPAEAVRELEEAIARAELVLGRNTRPELMDHQVYILYLTLHGCTEDIGARFAGFKYAGFEQYL